VSCLFESGNVANINIKEKHYTYKNIIMVHRIIKTKKKRVT